MKFKQQLKRLTSSAAAVAIAVSSLLPVSESALRVSASEIRTVEEAVKWAYDRAEEQWDKDVDNAYGCQCVDLVRAYYNFLGHEQISGNACDYLWNRIFEGWVRNDYPQRGDVFVDDGDPGHVGIVVEVDGNNLTTVETNHFNHNDVGYTPDPAGVYSRYASEFEKFIHPDFDDPEPTVNTPSHGSSANIEEGCYHIVNAADSTYLNYAYYADKIGGVISPEQDGAYPITTAKKSGKAEQEFNLIHVGGGKYVLLSNYSSNIYVNCENDVPYNGVELTGRRAYEDDTQYFYFAEDPDHKGEYVIENGYNSQWVISGADSTGKPLKVKGYTGNANQRWKLEQVSKQTAPNQNRAAILKGIDVSEYQENINWAKVKNDGYDFAILRNGLVDQFTGKYTLDTAFEENYRQAKANGLLVGTYFFTGATNVSDMEAEVQWMVSKIDGKKFDLPVYLDIETSAQRNVSPSVMTEMAVRGCEIIENAGFNAGVYASESMFVGNGSNIDPNTLHAHGFEVWSASWDLDPYSYWFRDQCQMMQYSEKGAVAGIAGNVDLDVRYAPVPVSAAETTAPAQTTAPTTTTTTVKEEDDYHLLPIYQDTVEQGIYSIRNSNGYFLTNDADQKLGSGHPMSMELNEGLSTQSFILKCIGDGKYTIAAGNDPDFYVNCTVSTPDKLKAGIQISTWKEYTDGTQYFYLTPQEDSDEVFYLQSVLCPDLVIAPKDPKTVGSSLILQKYDPQNTAQTWTFEKAAIPSVETKQNIPAGDYSISNAAVGFSMTNRTDLQLGKGHPIEMDMNEALPTQRFTLKHIGDGKYTLAAGGEKDRYVNCTCAKPEDVKEGVQISSWAEYTDGTQYFYFTDLGDGQYIIRSALDKNLVIAPRSEICRSDLELQKYNGSKLQRWTLTKLNAIVTTTTAVTTTTSTTTTTTSTTEKEADKLSPVLDKTVKPAAYGIQNAGNGGYMTCQIDEKLGSSGHPVSVELYENLPMQHFTVNYLGEGQYTLTVDSDPKLFLDATCAKPENIRSDIPVSCWTEVKDSRQYFYLTPVGKDDENVTEYVIQNAERPELVVAPQYDDIIGSTLKIQKYDAENASQRWKLRPVKEQTTTTTPATTTTTTGTTTTTTVTNTTTSTTTTSTGTTTTTTVTNTTTGTTTTTTVTSTTTTTGTTTSTTVTSTTTTVTTTQTDETTFEPQTTTVTVTTSAPAEPDHRTGDADGDGEISAEDAQIALGYYVCVMAGLDSGLTDAQITAMDIDGDGRVTAADAQCILLYYVNNTVTGTPVTWEELLAPKKLPRSYAPKIRKLFHSYENR